MKCDCISSTAICGCISKGKGELDWYGFWSIPCPHGNEFEPFDHDCSYHGSSLIALLGLA